MTYTNVILTVIALLLAAIAGKLYLHELQDLGPRISPPTRGDYIAAIEIEDSDASRERMAYLRENASLIWVVGGSAEVKGSVEVTNTVSVEGEVSIDGRW